VCFLLERSQEHREARWNSELISQRRPGHLGCRICFVMDMEEIGKQLRAKMDASWNEYREFGQWKPDLEFDQTLPLESPPPEHPAPDTVLAQGDDLVLRCGRTPGGLSYFFLNDQLIPVGIFVHNRSYISTLKETRRKEGFDWSVTTPSFDDLVSDGPAKFDTRDDRLVAKLYQDLVVHSAGITTTVHLALNTKEPSLEIQLYEDFSG
jgi:hypothetical protein